MADTATVQTAMHFATSETNVKKQGYYEVPASKLRLAKDFEDSDKKFNRRRDMGNDIPELMESLYTQGPRVPLHGKKVIGEDLYDVYQGERRLTAAKLAFEKYGVDIIFKVIVYPPTATRRDIVLDTLLTNWSKELNPLEKADTVEQLLSEGMQEKEIAQALGGISTTHVKNLRRLLNAPEEVKELIRKGIVSATFLMPYLRNKSMDWDSFIEEIKAHAEGAAEKPKTAKVTAKKVRKAEEGGEGEEGGEEQREEIQTRAASSIGEFKRFRRNNSGIWKGEKEQFAFEFICDLVDNKLGYEEILERLTGK